MSSLPVKVCFCNSQGDPDCDYQPPTVNVKKGEAFTVTLVAVDQVNNTLDTKIHSYLSSHQGAFEEGQQIQMVADKCTTLTFNIFSSNSFETLILYADGPCANSTLSVRYLNVIFASLVYYKYTLHTLKLFSVTCTFLSTSSLSSPICCCSVSSSCWCCWLDCARAEL